MTTEVTRTSTTGARSGSVHREALAPPSYLQACLLVVRRNLIHIRRMPELLMDVTVQPVMFVLLFAYVFGSSIDVPGTRNSL